LPLLFSHLEKLGMKVGKVTLKTPSLDDVYLSYTGRELREEHSSKEKAMQDRFTMRRLRT